MVEVRARSDVHLGLTDAWAHGLLVRGRSERDQVVTPIRVIHVRGNHFSKAPSDERDLFGLVAVTPGEPCADGSRKA